MRRVFRRDGLPVAGLINRSRVWLAALAASLLIAVGTAIALRSRSAPHQPPSASPPIASSEVPANKPAAPTAVPAVAPVALPARNQSDAKIAESGDPSQHGEPVKWGDSVDDEITAIGQAAIYVRQDDPSSRLWEIQTGLDQLNREVEHGRL